MVVLGPYAVGSADADADADADRKDVGSRRQGAVTTLTVAAVGAERDPLDHQRAQNAAPSPARKSLPAL